VVRIDMLERLADLVRDRVFWKARFPDDVRPAGSVEGGGFLIVADMMSLVGCSGEEFQGILQSLGFRMQKKKITRPAIAASRAAETPAETPNASEAVAEVAAPIASEPVTTEATPEPVLEEIELDVWWPRDTGPFRPKPEARERRRPAPKAVEQIAPAERPKRPERKAYPKNNSKDRPREEPKPRPEKPMDPNSPFAVLSALKAQMTGNKT
jgi:ATP-dependent RNA helicase SUPV3L1/SUV3